MILMMKQSDEGRIEDLSKMEDMIKNMTHFLAELRTLV